MGRHHCNSCHCYIIPFVGVFCLCPVCFDQWYPGVWYRPELNPPISPIPFSRGGGVTAGRMARWGRSPCLPTCHPARPCTLHCSGCGGSFQHVRLLLGGGRDTLGRQKGVSSFHRYHKARRREGKNFQLWFLTLLRPWGEKEKRAWLLHICSQRWLELFVQLLEFVMMSPSWKTDFLVTVWITFKLQIWVDGVPNWSLLPSCMEKVCFCMHLNTTVMKIFLKIDSN